MSEAGKLALVLSGGGARAAYQVGVLRCLVRHFPELHFPLITGVSAGAINAVHLANHRGTLAQALDDLMELWSELTTEQVFRVDSANLLSHLLRWGVRLVSGGLPGAPQVRGLVDTAPLRAFLERAWQPQEGVLTGVRANLWEGRLQALAVTTASYTTGQSVTWVQGEEIKQWERPLRHGVRAEITLDHVMASASLPLFFPAIKIGQDWHGDGGIRQAAPLSTAIHLGAERILAVSTLCEAPSGGLESDQPPEYPPPAQILSLLLDAIFLDALSYDAHLLERINRLLLKLPEEERSGLRPIKLLALRPAFNISQLAAHFEPQLPYSFRFLTRGLGTRESQNPDSLSMIMFEPEYIAKLLAAGEADATSQLAQVEELLA